MSILHFAAGFILGAKTGERGFDEVIAAAKQVLSSEEFAGFVAALRSHAAFTLRKMGDLVDAEQPTPGSGDLVDFVRTLVERRESALQFLRGRSGEHPA